MGAGIGVRHAGVRIGAHTGCAQQVKARVGHQRLRGDVGGPRFGEGVGGAVDPMGDHALCVVVEAVGYLGRWDVVAIGESIGKGDPVFQAR